MTFAANMVDGLLAFARPTGTLPAAVANIWVATTTTSILHMARTRRLHRGWLFVATALSAAANLASVGEDDPDHAMWRYGQSISTAIAASAVEAFSPLSLGVVTTVAATWGGAALARRRRGVIRPSHDLMPILDLLGTSFGVALASHQLRRFEAEARRLERLARDHAATAAAEAERERQHRLLHDTALQTLEAVSGDWYASDDIIRRLAAADAARLRRAIAGDDTAVTLATGLTELARLYRELGLHVSLDLTSVAEPSSAAATMALTGAANEALQNVVKHAGVCRVEMVAGRVGDSATVTIRDDGAGFDPSCVLAGFGLTESIRARVVEVSGSADIESAPGAGTTVRLGVPIT